MCLFQVVADRQTPRKDDSFVSKAMEYMFGWWCHIVPLGRTAASEERWGVSEQMDELIQNSMCLCACVRVWKRRKIFSFSCFIKVFFNVLLLIKYVSDLNFVMLRFNLKLPQAKNFKYLFCWRVTGRWSFSRVVKSKSSGTLIFNYLS